MICPKCNGVGRIPFGKEPEIYTNEEWRKICSTEELAEELTKVVLDIISWNNDPKPSEVRNILKVWLKRIHREEKHE